MQSSLPPKMPRMLAIRPSHFNPAHLNFNLTISSRNTATPTLSIIDATSAVPLPTAPVNPANAIHEGFTGLYAVLSSLVNTGARRR